MSGPKRFSASVAAALLIIAIATGIRIRLREVPLERDEGEYAYAGQLIRQGIPPYQAAYNMKLPGTYYAYALQMTAFGETPAGIRLGLMLVSLLTTGFVFLLARQSLGSAAAWPAAAAFSLLSVSDALLGTFGHATHYVLLFAVPSIWLHQIAIRDRRGWLSFASGLLLGLAMLMKQHAVFFLALLFLQLFDAARRESGSLRERLRTASLRFGLLLAGAALPLAVIAVYLWSCGLFGRFWFWTFSYARAYAAKQTLAQGIALFRHQTTAVLRGLSGFVALAGVGLTTPLWDRSARAAMPFLGSFLAIAFAAVCPGWIFREHYFILMLPPLALLVGQAVASATGRLAAVRPGLRELPTLVLLIVVAHFVFRSGEFFLRAEPQVVSRTRFGGNPFPESLPIARYIAERTGREESIVVIGSEPQIYFYAHRHAATGYLYTYPLMEPQPFASAMRDEMIGEIEKAVPAYAVFVGIPTSWLARPDSDTSIFDWASGFLEQHYQRVGRIDIVNRRTTLYCFDQWVDRCPGDSELFLEVYRRRSAR